jgi:para-aminobenzoate synthetase/4-amino-4-deoxychorismate lyase
VFDPAGPFVLLDDASTKAAPGQLYARATAIVTAQTLDEIGPALGEVERLRRAGHHVAGYLAYEAGFAFEPRTGGRTQALAGGRPLLWFGAFTKPQEVDTAALLAEVAAGPASVHTVRPMIGRDDYLATVDRAKAFIAAGDVYQINLTFGANVEFDGHPLALYARLRRAQRMAFGAVIHTGTDWLLSASPELFFKIDGRRIDCRPMKGTAPRGARLADDEAARSALAADAKNRAENLMITDLLRNDLSRISRAGSVRVRDAFAVETYPTLFQMTTSVEAELSSNVGPIDALRALFPCGSITGAPKVRAMQIIGELEAQPRGVYTGAIGYAAADGTAAFSVAIRTLDVERQGHGRIGAGSGIVADSEAAAEWQECMQKMAFLKEAGQRFHLIETMRFSPDEAIPLLPFHLARLKASARRFGFALDVHQARNLLQAAVGGLKEARRVKLTVDENGGMAVTCTSLPETNGTVRVRLVPLPVRADDIRLYHKTSDRAFYDAAREASGADECVFVRSDGRITEGSRTNVFVRQGDMLLTPPVEDGLLGGVLRQSLVESGRAETRSLTSADLAGGFFLGNAVRNLIPARLVEPAD